MPNYLKNLMMWAVVLPGVIAIVYAFSVPPIKYSKLTVNLKIKNDANEVLDSALVRITDSTGLQPIDSILTAANGKANFKLEYEREYRVYVEKEGYVGIFLEFNTDVPSSKVYKDYTMRSDLTLLDDTNHFNRRAVAERPSAKIYFDESYDQFRTMKYPEKFIEELERPNIGRMTMKGKLNGIFNDSLPVHIFVLDSNDEVVSETFSDAEGNYELNVDMMQPKTKVYFEGDNVHPVYAEVSTMVPDSMKENDYVVSQNIEMVSSEEPINVRATALPVESIEYKPEEGAFVTDAAVSSTFKEKIFLNRKRITVKGSLANEEGKSFKPTKVQIKDGNTLIDEVTIDSTDFELKIPYQSIVKVNFESEGYHGGFITFSTYMEDEEMENAKEFSTDVELYDTARSDINARTFKTLPMAKYSYDPEVKGFKKDTVVEQQFYKMLREIREARTDSLPKGKLKITNGQIVDMSTGKGVPFVEYQVLDGFKEHTLVKDTTDKKGRYSVSMPLGQRYYIQLRKDNYFTTEHYVDARMPDSYNSDRDFSQKWLEGLPIIHQETTYDGSTKRFPSEVVEHTVCMGFYYDEATEFFVLDSASIQSFEKQIDTYRPPPPPEPEPDTPSIAQEVEEIPQELRLEGQLVNKTNQAMVGVPIVLMEKGKRLESDTTDSSGTYAINLPFMKELLTVQVKSDSLHPSFIELSTMLPDSIDPVSDTLSIAPFSAYNVNDPDANPEAFKNPVMAYDYGQGNFIPDEAAADEFKATLDIVPDYRLIAVEGRARDTRNKNIENARVVVLENGSPVDTVFTDKKGRYVLSLDYQKEYKFSVQKDGYKSSYVAISTQTSQGNERLVDKKIKGLNLLLVKDDVQNLNDPTLSRPYARYAFDGKKEEFVEVKEVNNSFMADLFIKEEKKKEVQLTTEKVAVVRETGEKGFSDERKIGVVESNEAVEKRKQNKNQAAKNAVMGDFHQALAGISVGNRRDLKNVNLALENILNTGYEVTNAEQSELDESMLDAVENRQLLSEIVAGLGLNRGDVEPVSLDSTFSLYSNARVYHSEEGIGVYIVHRDKVYRPGEIVEYVKEVDWWFFDSYYRNNEKISASEYEQELALIKSSGHVLDFELDEKEES